MMNNPKIDELLQLLASKGVSPEEVKTIRDHLLQQVLEAFMGDAFQSLSDEDLRNVDAASSNEEAHERLKQVYAEKTGKNADEEMRKIVDQKAQELIEKYRVEATPVTTNNGAADDAEIAKAEDELHKIAEQTHDPVKTADPTNWQ